MTTIGNTFRTAEPGLTELLEQIHKGEVKLPDFQRDWVWDDDHIRSLIASVSRSFPIGSVMLLETGGDGIRFKPRAIEGAPEHPGVEPKYLILDGQQRMTSLYLALRSGRPVSTKTEKKKPIDRLYYLDINLCLDPDADREDAVKSIPADRMIRTDFNREVKLDVSTADKEYASDLFPISALFGDYYYEWCESYRTHHNYDKAKLAALGQFERDVTQRFRQYRVPAIELTRESSRESVCLVFEKVNTGGVSLTVFELVTATFAADGYPLRKDWDERCRRLHGKQVLKKVWSTDFLQAVTLLASYRRSQAEGKPVSCKRRDILNLTLAEYKEHADLIENGFFAAAQLLGREKIFDARNLPYNSQLVPLAAICAALDDRFESDGVKQKLARWYWCGVFGELYGGSTETRFGNDIVDVLAWLDGGPEPRTVRDSNLAPTRLLTLQSRQSAAYKGMMALLMQAGSHDFINGDAIEVTTFFDKAVDIHHIFPKKHCNARKHPRAKWNSVINKTPLTGRTNRILSGHAPSTYLASIEKNHKMASDRLDEILGTHLIAPALLRADDFDAFIRDRACQLLDLIERHIGKAVTGRDAHDVIEEFGAPLVSPSGGSAPPAPGSS